MEDSLDLRAKRAALVDEMQIIVEQASAEGRSLSSEENEKWEKINADVDSMKSTIDKIERQGELNSELVTRADKVSKSVDEVIVSDEENKRADSIAFRNYLMGGMAKLSSEERALVEKRAQSVGTASAGGYLVPEGFSYDLDNALKAYGACREACDVFKTASGNDLPWPTVNDTGNTGELLTENTQAAAQDVAFGSVTLGAYMFSSKLVLVSLQLMQDSAFDIQSFLSQKLAERIGRGTNAYFTTGTGSSQPEGIVKGSTAGVTAASATAITANEVLDLYHSVDPAYRAAPGAAFMMNDSTLKALKKLGTGSANDPVFFTPGIQAGDPDTLLGKPIFINQDMADIATGEKTMLFGDMKKFKIRDVLGYQMLRMNERYADYLQVGFLGFMRCDSKMIDAGTNPIKHLVQA